MRLLMRFCHDLHDQNLYIGKVRESYAGVSFASARFDFLESLRTDLVEGKVLPFIRFIYRSVLFRYDTLKLFKICEWMIDHCYVERGRSSSHARGRRGFKLHLWSYRSWMVGCASDVKKTPRLIVSGDNKKKITGVVLSCIQCIEQSTHAPGQSF